MDKPGKITDEVTPTAQSVVVEETSTADPFPDNSDRWCGNERVFATREAAETYAVDLASRWTLVREWRVVETEQSGDDSRPRDGSSCFQETPASCNRSGKVDQSYPASALSITGPPFAPSLPTHPVHM